MIVPIGLIIAFALVVIFTKRSTRKCRWRENSRLNRDGQTYFKCMFCGAVVFTALGKEPDTCMKDDVPPI